MKKKTAFSLVELLIVIALIVLMLAIAMPAFHFITGSNSVQGATNQLGAMVGRTRTEAVGLQEPRGLLFYIDPRTGLRAGMIVKPTEQQASDATDTYIDPLTKAVNKVPVRYYDAASDDQFTLPKGVGIQFCNPNPSAANLDRYIGFNIFGGQSVPIGGILLFDGSGRLVSHTYGFRMKSNGAPTQLAKILFPNASTPPADFVQSSPTPKSHIGCVLFNADELDDVTGRDSNPDPLFSGADATEVNEESWIDNNAVVLLINRYNGTLVKGE